MKKPIGIFLPILLITFLYSCGNLLDETQALQLNEEGLAKLYQGEHEEAILILKEALTHDNASRNTKIIINRNIAICYHELEEWDQSIHFSKEAVKLTKEGSYDYCVNQADVDLLEGNIDRAIKNLKVARHMKPDAIEVNNTLGLIYMGDYDEAFTDYKRALPYNLKAYEVGKDRSTSSVLGANYIELGEFEKAETIYNELHENIPGILDHKYYLGLIKYRLGKTEEAKQLLDELVEIDSTYREYVEDIYQ